EHDFTATRHLSYGHGTHIQPHVPAITLAVTCPDWTLTRGCPPHHREHFAPAFCASILRKHSARAGRTNDMWRRRKRWGEGGGERIGRPALATATSRERSTGPWPSLVAHLPLLS